MRKLGKKAAWMRIAQELEKNFPHWDGRLGICCYIQDLADNNRYDASSLYYITEELGDEMQRELEDTFHCDVPLDSWGYKPSYWWGFEYDENRGGDEARIIACLLMAETVDAF